MYYSKLLKNKIYLIQGKLNSNDKSVIQEPWGEVDWQSGKERWILMNYALFDGVHDQFSQISIIPEAINFIDRNSILLKDNIYEFESLSVFQNNPYFNMDYFDALALGKNGKFSNRKLANGEMDIIGEFSIIRIAKPSELVLWIDDI